MWIDYDNDNDKDLFLSSYNGKNKLFENKGFLNFLDVSSDVGLPDTIAQSFASSWADINNDGYLDLLQTYRSPDSLVNLSHLFLSDSAKSFVNVSSSSGIYESNKLPFCATFIDIDNNNNQDLYIANDKNTGNSMYYNNGDGSFSNISSSSNTGIKVDGMSVTVGDYNNDLYFDIYTTNLDSNSMFFINNKDLKFSERANELGIGFNGIGWGAQFEDFNLDGYEDLYVSGSLTGSDIISSAFYFNNSGETFIKDNSIGFQMDTLASYGNAIGDYNGDGLPDIIVLNMSPGKSFLFK